MRRLLLILLICILFSGCIGISTYNNFKQNFSYLKFNNQSDKTNGLFNISGYYALTDNTNYTSYFMFFKDGSYADQIYFDEENNINGFSVFHGLYQIYGDTIKVQIMFKGVGLTGSSYNEKCYKVIDRNTLKLIYLGKITTTVVEDFYSKTYLKEHDISEYTNSYARFIPLDSIPYFENTLKKDKFFWKDEKDWKEYMKTRKK